MDKMRLDKGGWLVVCDGRKALILENLGDEMFPNLHTREVHEQPNPMTSAQGSDAPGRLHAAAGGLRSSAEQTDWHDEAERAFLRGLAGRLDAAVSSGETTALTMVASPRALGMIRRRLFGRHAQGAAGRGRQGPRQAAGLRDREAIAAVGRRQIEAPAEATPAPLSSRGAGGGPGRHRRPRSGSNDWSTGRRKRRRYRG
ncbi:protein required for attachment to host cells [Bradyrhizobium ottawaense]